MHSRSNSEERLLREHGQYDHSSAEYEGFLEVEAEKLGNAERSHRHFAIHFCVLYTVIAIQTIAILFMLTRRSRCGDPSQGIYCMLFALNFTTLTEIPLAPAQDIIKYETKVFAENFVTKGPYMGSEQDGLPTNTTDDFWEELYQRTCWILSSWYSMFLSVADLDGLSSISGKEASRIPNRTTLIPETENNYVVELDVFHQLHCLNAVRKTLYPERYWDEFDDYYLEDGSRNYTSTAAKHYGRLNHNWKSQKSNILTLIDHCVDSIRQSLMCHSDLATVYWQWMPFRRIPLPRLEITHTCRNFEAVQQWAKDHELEKDPRWHAAPEESFVLSPIGAIL